MSKPRIRRPVEEEALSRVTRWEKREKRDSFDVAYFEEFKRYPIYAEENTDVVDDVIKKDD